MPDVHSYISPSYLHLLCKCSKSLEFDVEGIEEENEHKIGIICMILTIILFTAILITSFIIQETNEDKFEITKAEYNKVYELTDKSWFLIDRENNKYIFQPVELGDWDYELNSEKELKNIIATYFINKYNTNENEIINNIDKVFKTIE